MKMLCRQWRRILMMGVLGCCVAVGGEGVSSAAITTATITFDFEEIGGTHAATAVLTKVEDSQLGMGTLTIELTNNSIAAVNSGTDVLLGMFFNSGVTFLPSGGSAVVPAGETTIPGSPLVDPGNGWQIKSGISISKGTKTYNSGIAGAGYGVFGPDGNLGTNPVKLDGSDYGIVGSGTVNANPSVKNPIFSNRLEFTIPYSGSFEMRATDTVLFQYGTDLKEPSFIGIDPPAHSPEPTTILLVAIGAGGLALQRTLRRGPVTKLSGVAGPEAE